MQSCFYYSYPIGKIAVVAEEEAVWQLLFTDQIEASMVLNEMEIRETPLIKEVGQQLDFYFAGKLKTFDLPLQPMGTVFQKQVWEALLSIPYGEVRTYKEIAQQIQCPKGYRAVGLANNKNPLPILIPCHRVIGSSGKLVGYAGGLDIKSFLLDLES